MLALRSYGIDVWNGPAPNPFNPSTVIAFDLARAGTVRLEVYDLGGRRVHTLVSGPLPAQRMMLVK